MLEDVETFDCHLDYLGAWCFENFHGLYKSMKRGNNGNMILAQIRFVHFDIRFFFFLSIIVCFFYLCFFLLLCFFLSDV